MTDEPMITMQIRLSQDLLTRIDVYRRDLKIRPSRSQTIRFLLETAMDTLENNQERSR